MKAFLLALVIAMTSLFAVAQSSKEVKWTFSAKK